MNIHHVINLLDSTDRKLTQQVCDQLTEIGSGIVPDLIENFPTVNVRQALHIIGVLGTIGDETSIRTICHTLLHHDSLIVRSKSAEILGNFPNQDVMESLIQSLQNTHEHEMVTMWVVTSLGAIANIKAYEALIAYLKQTDSTTMKYMTIRALGEQGNSQAVQHILPHVESDDRHIHRECQIALQKLGFDRSNEVNK